MIKIFLSLMVVCFNVAYASEEIITYCAVKETFRCWHNVSPTKCELSDKKGKEGYIL